ncbi:MAG TPA: chitobiase/beta-hexosaminidase C-terminal domain-containing protein, partial [Opitutaceae bacterium]|nr:chitobiase/beta-hexosaminidase C-terminal domain-containing protein [Opitutaceae bacterium]
LSAPVFRIYGDISSATFPINSVANLPPTNPPGTFYRYTTDGTTPTTSSSLWNNNPAWTPLSFPAQVTLRAFHSDPQYSPSAPVSASYTFVLSVALTRADGRLSSLNTFTLPELSSPNLNGIVLTSNITGTTIRFTLDGTDPRVSGTAYSGAFAPPAGLFAPTVNLKTVAVSTDPRYTSSAISIYQLAPQSTSLPVPVIVTDNSSPLDAGTPVNIAYNYAAGSTRTAINATPNGTSSTARSFPIN